MAPQGPNMSENLHLKLETVFLFTPFRLGNVFELIGLCLASHCEALGEIMLYRKE